MTLEHVVHIDSRERNLTQSQRASDYVLRLQNPISNVSEIELASVLLPIIGGGAIPNLHPYLSLSLDVISADAAAPARGSNSAFFNDTTNRIMCKIPMLAVGSSGGWVVAVHTLGDIRTNPWQAVNNFPPVFIPTWNAIGGFRHPDINLISGWYIHNDPLPRQFLMEVVMEFDVAPAAGLISVGLMSGFINIARFDVNPSEGPPFVSVVRALVFVVFGDLLGATVTQTTGGAVNLVRGHFLLRNNFQGPSGGYTAYRPLHPAKVTFSPPMGTLQRVRMSLETFGVETVDLPTATDLYRLPSQLFEDEIGAPYENYSATFKVRGSRGS